jgi:tight adherence protein B
MAGPLAVGLATALAVLTWPMRPPARARLRSMWVAPQDDPEAHRTLRSRLAGSIHRRLPWGRSGGGGAGEIDREVLALLEGVAGALRAGLTPAQAFGHLATAADLGRPSATDPSAAGRSDEAAAPLARLPARLGANASAGARLEPVLRAEASRLGSPALLAAASGWAMAERFGAPVVDVLDGLVVALRDSARTAAAIDTALAAPRATATLLALLPFGGVLLGESVGVHPVAVLIGTPIGRADLVLGLLATWCGRVWMRRLVRGVERA